MKVLCIDIRGGIWFTSKWNIARSPPLPEKWTLNLLRKLLISFWLLSLHVVHVKFSTVPIMFQNIFIAITKMNYGFIYRGQKPVISRLMDIYEHQISVWYVAFVPCRADIWTDFGVSHIFKLFALKPNVGTPQSWHCVMSLTKCTNINPFIWEIQAWTNVPCNFG